MPPPSVSPPTPVWETLPAVVVSPCSIAARSSAPSSAPPCTHARRRSGSTRTPPIGRRSIISPPSGTHSPSTLCPPQRTPISRSCSRRVADRLGHVVGVRAAHDRPRPALHHRVPHRPCLVVSRGAVLQEPALRRSTHRRAMLSRAVRTAATGAGRALLGELAQQAHVVTDRVVLHRAAALVEAVQVALAPRDPPAGGLDSEQRCPRGFRTSCRRR